MRPEEDLLGGRENQLGRLIEEGIGGGRTVWASFNWILQVDLETALEQQKSLADLVGAQSSSPSRRRPWKRLSKSGRRRRSGRRSPHILAPFWSTSPSYP